MFVYYVMNDAGSAQDILHYVPAARSLGHEIVVYGRPVRNSPIPFSLDVRSSDAVVFIFEWTTELREGDALDWSRLVAQVPRRRRVVIDCDGAYNQAMLVDGDYNHRGPENSRVWMDACESLADKICQPSLHPIEQHVRPFLFHAYEARWETECEERPPQYGMVYVGHSKFRWGPMERVLRAVEPVRSRVGRIALVGHGWDTLPEWAEPMAIEDFYRVDRPYLIRMGVEFVAPVPSPEVIGWMSRALINPVIYRPLFSHLHFVTCRTFETPAAGTIPLLVLDRGYVAEIYGPAAEELILPEANPEQKIEDLLNNPNHYHDVVRAVRTHLRREHSYSRRVEQLVEIVSE